MLRPYALARILQPGTFVAPCDNAAMTTLVVGQGKGTAWFFVGCSR